MSAQAHSSPDYSFLSALGQPISRPKTGFAYLLCLALVTCAMMLLPLVYIAFVGGLAWAVYYHAVYNWHAIMHFGGIGGGRVMILKFLIYFVPLLAGVVVVFFMFKPLLAGRPKRAQPLALNPSDNPVLYAFIAKICDAVGAPSPRRIDLDCDLNASASFRRGFLSMFGNDLVLTIGLPLVANLSARELAGVIAHEFGHFTQGAGMRLSYVIRSINFWFARVAYQRDAWDEALEDWSNQIEDGRVAIIVWSVQIAVFFSRLILKLLLFIGIIISGFMLRQMEYDADAYEIKVAGSEAFESTMRKLHTLGAALDLTYKKIHGVWKKSGQLPDNLSELLRQAHENLPSAALQKIDDALGLHRTKLVDSHPSPSDRIRKARLAADPGIFHDPRPATELFSSFDHPARFVTLLHYTDDLGIPIKQDMLLRVHSTRPKTATQAAPNSDDICGEYFLGVLPLLMPLRIAPPVPAENFEAASAELQQLSTGLLQIAPQLAPIASQYSEISKKLVKARAAARLIGSGVAIQPGDFGLAETSVASAHAAEAEAIASREALRHSLHEVADALRRRLQLALSLKLAERGEFGADSASPGRVQDLVLALNRAGDDYDKYFEAADSVAVLNRIAAIRESGGETPALSKALAAQNEIVNSFISKPADPAAAMPVKSGLQLQLARQPAHVGAAEIESQRQKTFEWLAGYQANLEQLVQIARTVEGIPQS